MTYVVVDLNRRKSDVFPPGGTDGLWRTRSPISFEYWFSEIRAFNLNGKKKHESFHLSSDKSAPCSPIFPHISNMVK